MQIPVCHVHSDAHKHTKTVAVLPTNFKKSLIWTLISRKLSQIENWDFRFRFRNPVRSASLSREYATPTLLTPTSPPVAPTIFMLKKNVNCNVLVSSIPIVCTYVRSLHWKIYMEKQRRIMSRVWLTRLILINAEENVIRQFSGVAWPEQRPRSTYW